VSLGDNVAEGKGNDVLVGNAYCEASASGAIWELVAAIEVDIRKNNDSNVLAMIVERKKGIPTDQGPRQIKTNLVRHLDRCVDCQIWK